MRALLALLSAGAALAVPLSAPAERAPLSREQRVRYTPQDREVGRYQYVPVAVPAGATRLTVRYAYDRAEGANVVDLGLFEPGPLDLGTPAFRGWSGGAATEVAVGPGGASPGYWPGALPAGDWHVALGLYKVAPHGVEVTVTSEVSFAPDPRAVPALAPRPTGPLRSGPAWFSGGLHLHTVHSDGRHTTADVLRRAREAGLDFVAVTDHNNTTHQLDAVEEPGLLRIVGEEVTTPGGHASVWGLAGWRSEVDFRLLAGDERIKDLVREVVEQGALFAINHPRAECDGCGWEHLVPQGVTGVEISEAGRRGTGPALAWWDSLLAQGRRLVGIGTSDWHRETHPVASASVRVWARELSEAAVLEGLRSGRVVVMAEGRMPPPEMTVRAGGRTAVPGDTLEVARGQAAVVEVALPAALPRARVEVVWDGAVAATVPAAADAPARHEQRVERDGYVRAQVLAEDGTPLAVINPVYLRAGRAR